mmetsp:Transcript_51521/g.149658  ORF Transcript_51521/g.149658 Transcript_51521/m.149658 type:complete len:246 (-) Transcript_51521:49-786(-)
MDVRDLKFQRSERLLLGDHRGDDSRCVKLADSILTLLLRVGLDECLTLGGQLRAIAEAIAPRVGPVTDLHFLFHLCDVVLSVHGDVGIDRLLLYVVEAENGIVASGNLPELADDVGRVEGVSIHKHRGPLPSVLLQALQPQEHGLRRAPRRPGQLHERAVGVLVPHHLLHEVAYVHEARIINNHQFVLFAQSQMLEHPQDHRLPQHWHKRLWPGHVTLLLEATPQTAQGHNDIDSDLRHGRHQWR